MSADHITTDPTSRPGDNTPEEQRRATLYVASNATDADDCAELLRALGLLDPGFHWIHTGGGHGTQRRRRIEKGQTA